MMFIAFRAPQHWNKISGPGLLFIRSWKSERIELGRHHLYHHYHSDTKMRFDFNGFYSSNSKYLRGGC